MKKPTVTEVFFRPDLFPVGDELDELATGTTLRFELEEYLLRHDPDLQPKADQLIKDLLAGIDVRKQLKTKPTGRKRRQTSRTLALAREHARLVKNGYKAKATRLMVAKLEELKIGVDGGGALTREIDRAVAEFPSSSTDVKKYQSKLRALKLI